MSDLIAGMNAVGDAWATAIWRASWQGAIAIAAVWVACRIWRRMPPDARVWLWRLAFLKLLAGLISIPPVALPVLPAPSAGGIGPPAASPGLTAGSITDLPLAPADLTPETVFPTLASILLGAYALGLVWCAVRVALSWRAARRLRAESRPVTDSGLLAALTDVCRTTGVRRPPVMAAGKTSGPLLVGVRRPVIVVPETLLTHLRPREASLMLAHEVAHLKRRDLWWNWLALAVQGMFFFHPLVWLGGREWALSQEMACDALALATTRGSQAEYGGMLVAVVAEGGKRGDEAVAVGIAESFQTVRRRLAAMALLAPVSRRRLLVIAAVVTMAAVAALVPWRATARRSGALLDGGEDRQMRVGVTEPVTLNGHDYEIRWVNAGRLSEAALLATGTATVRDPDGEYSGHADPLYNIHCEIGPEIPPEELKARLEREGRSWNEHWRELAQGLSPEVTWFALAAYSDGKLAGQVRFFPDTVGRLRVVAEQTPGERSADVLLISAGFVDLPGAEDGLDKELVRRVVAYARQQGYVAVRALAWSDIRAYAMWGESFPVSTYESLGFRRATEIAADGAALEDMLAGRHGTQVQRLVREAMDRGLAKEQANTRYLVQLDIAEGGARSVEYPKAAMLDDVPAGAPDCNSYARGLETALNYVGTPGDADTIMGDTGMAFILMSEEGGPLIDGAVDVGWWPLASWGIEMRLGFLAQAVGREIRFIPADAAAYRADPAAHYRARFEREVKASIAAGRPVLVVHDICFVAYGYDEKEPPLLGNWAPESKRETVRVERYPWGLIVLGEEVDRMDRKAADVAALRHAIALARDELDVKLPAYWSEWEPVTARYTGQKSFALWAEMLRDTEHLGEARWHSNMDLHLGINRRAAVRYLQAMAARHPASAARHLTSAAGLYEQVLAKLETANTSEDAMMSEAGRERLAQLSEAMAALESRAADELERALAGMA